MRKLATVERILDIHGIPDADKIEVATVRGWHCVIKKGEFKPGDLVIYCEVDSWIPVDIAPFLCADGIKEYLGIKGAKLKTKKMRGQISQGLILPVTMLKSVEEGADVTEELGIIKWEPPIPASLSGQIKSTFPSIISKTDEERVQNIIGIIDEIRGVEVYWAVKMDGTSATFVNYSDDHHVCSRNMSLKETEGNTYWEMYHKYNIKNILDSNPDYAIQGEICGEGIQKNRMGLKGHHLYVFNIVNIKTRKILGLESMKEFCARNALIHVPIFKTETFNYNSVDELVEIATQCRYENGALGEGYVIRAVTPMLSRVLHGSMSFKVLNPVYLVKHDE